MTVTIKDIANVCGVSYSTVSRALSNHPAINEKTRAKIARVAQSMGYKPNAMARGLVMKKSHTLGLLIPDITNPFWPEVAKGAEDEANDRGYQILLCNTDLNEGKEILYISTLLERRVDGIIMAPSSLNVQRFLGNADTPVVFLDVGDQVNQHLAIAFDNMTGAYLGTRHLLSLGHTRIAFILGNESKISHQNRLEGYKRALAEQGLPLDPQLVFRTKDTHIDDGLQVAREILKAQPRPTAIFAINDLLALGVLATLDDLHIAVPAEISVMGFDDIALTALPNIRLTTIRQPQYEIGKTAARLLIERIEQDSDGQTASNVVTISPELVIRSTCAPPPGQP